MSTLPQSLVVNRAAISRVLDIPARRIVSIEVQFDDLVQVTLKATREDKSPKPKFIALSQLENHFHEFRKSGGQELILLSSRRSRSGTLIHQVEGQGGDVYLVEEGDTHLACTCEDWHQHETLCKHGWCVLHTLGCGSLLELWQMRSKEAAAAVKTEPFNAGRSAPKRFKGVSIE